MSGSRVCMGGTKPIDEMTLPELIELLHTIADEIELRMMQEAK